MKKVLSIVAFLALSISMMAGIHSYAPSSVLASGKWVKIRVSETGVCRMSFSEIQSAGLDPQQLRVFGYGGAQKLQDFSKPNIDDLPQVPVYVGDGYVLFWVQGSISWEYAADKGRFSHTRNTYSDYGYYFLTDNVGELLAPPFAEPVSGTPTDVTSYSDIQVHDYDSVNLIDRNGVSGGGRSFFGEQFKASQTRSFSFSTPDAISSEKSKVYVELAASSSEASTFKASCNGTSGSVSMAKIPDFYTMASPGTITLSPNTAEYRQTVSLQLQSSIAGTLGWLDFIELTTPTALRMRGDYLPVRTLANLNTSTPVRFCLANANANMQVWDVTDLSAIQQMATSLSNDTLYWTGSQANGVREYVAVKTNGSHYVSATVVGNVRNQNLHELSNIDYVIICPSGYEAEGIRLAQAHEQKQGITWAVVTDQQVYNEFSSGTPDATAYRWLMKMLYDRGNGTSIAKPRWLLLMGHGSFDNRKLLATSGTSLLLTYESKNSLNEVKGYATDDYFGFLNDNEGESDTQGRMDIGVGRLPVENFDEAHSTVDKLIRYINNVHSDNNKNIGKWKNQIVYLADDGENGTHTETAEKSAEMVRLQNPDFVVHKIFLDAYPQEVNASGESYPLAKNRLTNLLKNGVLFFDYSGHGGYNAITNESILNIKDIQNMSNENHAFWLFATCSFSHCDAGKRSSGEAAVLNPVGGAIGVLAATRTVYAGPNTELNRKVSAELFRHSDVFHYDMTIGEAVRVGKNNLGSDDNKMAYVLLGDPAIRLNYPTDYFVNTKTQMDTLNALSIQQVQGEIIDEDSLVVSDFNGKLDITIYDKMQSIPTRDNDHAGGEPKVVAYNDYPNTIFSGSTQVTEGRFQYTFMVPKDIRYNYGNGRIVYYAVSLDSATMELSEAVGHFEDFTVGGTNAIALADTTGPEMQIYLNSKAFKDGDRTYPTPRFFADLYDENGINTAGAGIGHDLMMIIDDSPIMIYSLNEYFTAENNSYQRGQVSYLMEKLEDGPHSLTFRAWDMLNNSTTKSLNFIVETGLDPSIYSVMTYPNPVRQQGVVNLIVNYDQPDERLTTEVYLYNINGQMVYRHQQNNPDQVSINLNDLGLQPGVYVYNVKIKSASSKYSTNAGKIIVTK